MCWDTTMSSEVWNFRFRGMLLVNAKSIKSGSFRGSLGQCVGEPWETQSSLLLGFIIA